jgi:protein-S-isoprenylcysteine O-methyltransferase Ste14
MFFIFLSLAVIAHAGRAVYEVLKIRGRVDPHNRIVFALVFADMCVLWISWFQMCMWDPWPVGLGPVARGMGLAVFVFGMLLFFGALMQLKTLENFKGTLVTNGIYRYLRHPMYFAFLCWLFGFAAFMDSGASFLCAFPFAANVLYWRKNEQRLLVDAYPGYRDYMRSTIF